jgi:SPP1 family predicted phage head-tail adaptor
MQSGKLNRRIQIQSQSASQDEYGQQLTTWTTVLSTWASIRAATSKEIYASSGFVSQISHVITLRYRLGCPIKGSYRVLYEDRIFQIQAVSDPDEGRKQINLLCLEIDEGPQT